MNCFDCQSQGRVVAAVAVCLSCGAGVCSSCVAQGELDVDDPVDSGSGRATRCLLCRKCADVLSIHPVRHAEVVDFPGRTKR